MFIQEPSTVLTNLLLLIFSLFCFSSLARKFSKSNLSQFFFALFFLLLAIMALCGTLYHINNSFFSLAQKYGTMITGGLLSTCLALAALFDNLKPKTALTLAACPLAFLIFYFSSIQLNSFSAFIFLQLANIVIVVLAYLKNYRSKKLALIYSACVTFIIASYVQAQNFEFFSLNHNDVFHLLSLLAVYLLYKAVSADKP